jgi:hypothetical protein
VCKLSVVVLPLYEANTRVGHGFVGSSLPVTRKTVNLKVGGMCSVCAYDSYWKKCESARVGTYSIRSYFSGASEYISEGSAINNHRSDSDVKISVGCALREPELQASTSSFATATFTPAARCRGQSRW